jgi:hypothetical protein
VGGNCGVSVVMDGGGRHVRQFRFYRRSVNQVGRGTMTQGRPVIIACEALFVEW